MAVVKTHHWRLTPEVLQPTWHAARPLILLLLAALLVGALAVGVGWTFSWLKTVFDGSPLWSSGGVAHEMPLLVFTTVMIVALVPAIFGFVIMAMAAVAGYVLPFLEGRNGDKRD